MKSPSLKAVKLLRNEIRPRTGYGEDFAEAKSFFDLIETALYCTTCNTSFELWREMHFTGDRG